MTDCTELKRLAEACVAAGEYLPGEAWAEDRGYCPAEVAFLEFAPVATPAAVLALIAENERLAKTADCWDRLNIQNKALSDSFRAERDQLKAENEALRKDAARLQSATAFVQKLCDSAGKQPSVATGYLHDILSALGRGE